MSVLIVVAHPDDEVLGCGASAAALAQRGVEVRSCILSADAEARASRPALDRLHSDLHRAQEILGLAEPVLGEFPNIRFNTVPHLDLVQFIEEAIRKHSARHILTHHPADLNNDHLQTSRACQAAARLFQRRDDVASLMSLQFMEILSSTDWSFSSTGNAFQPNSYCEIGENLELKVKALQAYRGVARQFPHPRSEEILRGLAAYRGGQAGLRYAEAFQSVFQRAEGLFTA